jgi:hypothetical protein
MPYFDLDDKVIYTPRGVEATVIKPMPGDEYLIEFEDKKLIPPQMIVPGTSLKPKILPYYTYGYDDDGYNWARSQPQTTYSDTNCRKCGGVWTETWIGKQAYYDCLKCKIKKEDA